MECIIFIKSTFIAKYTVQRQHFSTHQARRCQKVHRMLTFTFITYIQSCYTLFAYTILKKKDKNNVNKSAKFFFSNLFAPLHALSSRGLENSRICCELFVYGRLLVKIKRHLFEEGITRRKKCHKIYILLCVKCHIAQSPSRMRPKQQVFSLFH